MSLEENGIRLAHIVLSVLKVRRHFPRQQEVNSRIKSGAIKEIVILHDRNRMEDEYVF